MTFAAHLLKDKAVKNLKFYKSERLCGQTAIDALFAICAVHRSDQSALAYPWRAVWRSSQERQNECARILISVPKKRLRHAVDRVLMRRRCREAYRLQRHLLNAQTAGVDIAFIYVGKGTETYKSTSDAIARLLAKIKAYTDSHTSKNVDADDNKENS